MSGLSLRQQTAVEDLNRGHIATIFRGESVKLSHEIYPAAMFDRLVALGYARKSGEKNQRIWLKR